eukprot:CAMPEP_0197458832 /NCGR_PEP_ID=MMETSP1175-20131217/49756_1 /TAXON_ID=1003142 /ORGANISM="Triceratium dubium, Strain CCMP147" /LENGTH=248 /DNA_ID=CAMNT_0042993561 /DNA_START=68 /DNA_END=814 /DNA_ORIENTATION=+
MKKDCSFVYDRDCTKDICAVGAITNFTARLSDSMFWSNVEQSSKQGRNRRPSSMRGANRFCCSDTWAMKESLMFVTHFVGDIHQPLHCSRKTDLGGNKIHVYFGQNLQFPVIDSRGLMHSNWNLHAVWDDAIIGQAIDATGSRYHFEKEIQYVIDMAESSGHIDDWLRCSDGRNIKCASEWAEESWEDALTWAYRDEHAKAITDGTYLSVEYFSTRLPVVKRRLAAAGVRLAASLEYALANFTICDET